MERVLNLGSCCFEGLTECTERDPLAFCHMNDVVADVDEQGGLIFPVEKQAHLFRLGCFVFLRKWRFL